MRTAHLFHRVRRHAAKVVLTCLLALPLAATIFGDPSASQENRAPAPPVQPPRGWAELFKLPPAVDAWIADHVGWRGRMIETYTQLRYRLFHRFPTHQVAQGRDGRIFLASHNPAGDPDSAIGLACGWKVDTVPRIVWEANNLVQRFRARDLDVHLLIVPSAPIVYAEQLPRWMAARCDPARAPAYAILASQALAPDTRKRILFPLAELRAGRSAVAPFPLTFFHWSGAGPRLVAGLSQQAFWGRPADGGKPIPLVLRRQPSDIHWLFPGIALDSVAGSPDFTGTTITACTAPSCFPGMETLMQKMAIAGRFTNSAPGLAPRLVLVTDSFGENGAPWFARYYKEVVYVSTNSLIATTPGERARLRALLFRPGSGDDIVYLYHDATVYQNRIAYDLSMLAP